MEQLIRKTNRIVLARCCLLLGIVVLPIIAYNDYQNGHTAALVAKFVTVILLIKGVLYSFCPAGNEQVIRIMAYALFVMAIVGAMTKQDMGHALVWLPLLPFLFVFLAGLPRGLLLVTGYFVFFVIGYLSHPWLHELPRLGWETWNQAAWAYWTAAIFAVIYELSRRPFADVPMETS